MLKLHTPPPPPRHPTDTWSSSVPVGWGYLNFAWLGWGIWTGSVKSFQRNATITSLNIEAFKTNASLLRANGSEGKVQQGLQGLGFKAWSICRKSRWLIPDFLLNKNWVGHLKIIFAERGGGGGGGREKGRGGEERKNLNKQIFKSSNAQRVALYFEAFYWSTHNLDCKKFDGKCVTIFSFLCTHAGVVK